MTRRRAPHAVVVADHSRRPAGSRRRRRAAPWEPVNTTTTMSAPPAASGFYVDLADALRALLGPPDLSRPGSTCRGGCCAVPAFYDRATGVWRHLSDLNCCLRPDDARNTPGDRR